MQLKLDILDHLLLESPFIIADLYTAFAVIDVGKTVVHEEFNWTFDKKQGKSTTDGIMVSVFDGIFPLGARSLKSGSVSKTCPLYSTMNCL